MAAMANITSIGEWRIAWLVVGFSVDPLVPVAVVPAGVVFGKSGNATVVWLLHWSPVQHVMLQASKVQLFGWASNQTLKLSQPVSASIVME